VNRSFATLSVLILAGLALSSCADNRSAVMTYGENGGRIKLADGRMDRMWGDNPHYRDFKLHRLEIKKSPEILSSVKPVYPAALLLSKKSGRVTLTLFVNKEGYVEDVKLMETTDERFNQAAVQSAKGQKFHPAQGANGPLACFSVQSINFMADSKERSETKRKKASAVVLFTVGQDGHVTSAHVEKPGDPMVDKVAVANIKRLVFPADKTIGKQGVQKKITYTVHD
jgi:TonB family protein